MCMVQEKSAEGTVDTQKATPQLQCGFFFRFGKGRNCLKQVIPSVSRFHLSKENDYEMPILQQS